MNYKNAGLWILCISLLFSCAAGKNYSPVKKFPREELLSDYTLLRNILEAKHPSLYWYTSKDSMDMYFERYGNAINDSMTEQQFTWHILAPLVDKIHCGHTSVGMSKAYGKWITGKRLPSFPLYMKIWNDTMAVTGNLNRKDSTFRRGTLIHSINGMDNKTIIKRMFNYLPEDGYADNINYVRLSANFPQYHRNIFGLHKTYAVEYTDTTGRRRSIELPVYSPPRDSTKKDSTRPIVRVTAPRAPRLPRSKRLLAYRSFTIDSTKQMAVMTLNTFTKGNLRGFFRRSFKQLKREKIPNLVLDIRSNGGGRVGLSTLLTKYISRTPFKVSDSMYAITQTVAPYTRYIKGGFLNNIELWFIAHKKKDGLYHIRHLENKMYKPKDNGYRGNVFVLTNGPTFSAATLFGNAVKGQPGITFLGEETGGGWHGNNGIMIPDITLPITKTRVRLPLFRVVQYNHVPKTGSGIIPDIYVGTSYDALLKGYDKKMEVVKEIVFKK